MLTLLTMLGALAADPAASSPPEEPKAPQPRTAAPGISIPGVIGGDPIVAGQLDKRRIHAVIAADLSAIYACYSEAQPPPTEGYLTVAVSLDGNGTTGSVKLKNTVLNHPELESCVVDRLKRLHFDAPLDGEPALFAYPFYFTPRT